MASYAIGTLSPLTSVENPLKNAAFRGVRLTRRGRTLSRFAVVLSLLVIIASGYSALAGVSAGESSSKEHLEVIIVAPGESLWSIAALVGGEREETVARILELNALATPNLAAGTRLIIPTRE